MECIGTLVQVSLTTTDISLAQSIVQQSAISAGSTEERSLPNKIEDMADGIYSNAMHDALTDVAFSQHFQHDWAKGLIFCLCEVKKGALLGDSEVKLSGKNDRSQTQTDVLELFPFL